MTVGEVVQTGLGRLEVADIGGARLDAQLLMCHVLSHERAWLLAHDTDAITEIDAAKFYALIDKRAQHIPVVHLTGTREFYGLDMGITPDVLTPRVETEQMVEWAIEAAPQDGKIIDIGTGSGAIAIAVAKHRPDLEFTATEITDEAITVAKNNIVRHNVEIVTVKSDLWDKVLGKYDVVLTNLPYLRTDAELMPEVLKEPSIALFGGQDGLDLYRRFLVGLPEHLVPGGLLFTECDPWQHETLTKEAAKIGLTPFKVGYFILGFKLEN